MKGFKKWIILNGIFELFYTFLKVRIVLIYYSFYETISSFDFFIVSIDEWFFFKQKSYAYFCKNC